MDRDVHKPASNQVLSEMSGVSCGGAWTTGVSLVGRDTEVDRVRQALTTTAGGRALMLSAAPGMGKTVFLGAVAEAAAATGTRVLYARGVEFEADVEYLTLNQLLFPLRDAFDGLAVSHRQALLVTLGFAHGSPPNRLVLSNAVLMLLHAVSDTGPVLLVVDDVPWIDRASAAVLAFVSRGLSESRVSLLGAARQGADCLLNDAGLPQYELPPLDAETAARLLDARHAELAAPVRRRLLQVAQGNPRLLLELPAALRPEQRTTSELLPDVLPLTDRLRTVLAPRVSRLPTATRHMLLLATLEGTGDLGPLHAAAPQLREGLDLRALAPAERDELVRVDDGARRLLFLHPLLPSAVLEAATSGERSAAHRALAAALTDQPERHARHLGESLQGPDEQVALLLETAAHPMARRGDAAGALTALVRAAELSPRKVERDRRLAEAAHFGAAIAGTLTRARQLLDRARQAASGPGGDLRCATTEAHLLLNGDGDVLGAHAVLIGAIESGCHSFDPEDPALVHALHLLLVVCLSAGRPELWHPFHSALNKLSFQAPALLRMAHLAFDPADTHASAREQVDGMLDDVDREADLARTVGAAAPLLCLDRLPDFRASSWHMVRRGREGGGVCGRIEGLTYLCQDTYHTGRWEDTLELAEEGVRLCDSFGLGFRVWHFVFHQAMIAAARGDAHSAHALADRMVHWAAPRGVEAVLDRARHVRTIADLASGDAESAYAHATAISPAGSVAAYSPHALMVVMDLVEAALMTGRQEEAADHVRALEEARVEWLSPRFALIARGAAAQSAEDDMTALALFEKVVGVQGAEQWPFDEARVRLAYGERLRRTGAGADAQRQLIAALKTFVRLGARPWTESAQRALRAVGSGQPLGIGQHRAGLTPQEYEIAMLAASGLRNKEIAARMFISHRTVGAHLYQIFPKLGITSRAALRDSLAACASGDVVLASDAEVR